jgi:class 3 adenylate cyclase/tetratricopeptide (TPR) repeat protein
VPALPGRGRIVIGAEGVYARRVPVCQSCGRESEGAFAFCPYCGTRFPATALASTRARELRKTVTVLFCDVEGSTSLGETVDPETLREVLARYFERLSRIIERHGGTVEKFVGDAVMAVFGVPVLHEDDALRSLRAAAEIQQALPELGVRARIGVNTGEVVTGTAERLATGDAVNVAARLEQAAPAGEVLLGAETARLVRGAVDLEPVPPLELKGKSEPVAAYRLLAVREAAPRRLDAPMVGRQRELQELCDAFARVEHDRSCQLFTVIGVAGIGKSRLVAEFLAGVDALVLHGRCLSYGEGITYWPVVEIVKQLGSLPSEEAAGASLRSLLGESDAATFADEIAWAFRKLLEEQARQRPIVCVLDDLHWGEETFLDLVEHIAFLSRDARILLLCMARPELLERRAGWGGGQSNATTVLLEPLDEAETRELLDALGGVESKLREQIVDAAEGNPLYLEEMVALMRDSEDGDVSVPPSIQALLAARLDQLDAAERSVLERAAIEGRVFHRSAVQALLDEELQLSTCLVSLVRAELVRPERTQIPGDEAYRFRHLLIRDAAYDAMPKAARAELHERYATWFEEQRPDLVELDELVGHHLAQAARYRDELGRPDSVLAGRAAERLAMAGRRALWRGDDRAAATLLERAVELRRPGYDVALELDLATAQPTPQQAAAIAEETTERAGAAADAPGEAAARTAAAFHLMLAGEAGPDQLELRALTALPLLEQAGDHACLVHVWSALGYGVANARGQYGEWARAAEQALLHARLADQRPSHLFNLEVALLFGPTPADEALRVLDAVLPEVSHPHPLLFRSHLLAMLGHFDEAWPTAHEASERSRELSPALDVGEYTLAEIAALAGDYEDAARRLGGFCDFLEEHGQRALLSTFAPMLGRFLCTLGRWDEAEVQARLGRELGDEHDVATQSLWRQVQARVDSHRGRHTEAEDCAREALGLIDQTDALNYQGAALSDLAEVLIDGGRTDEAGAALAQALERYERKRNFAAAAQVRARVAALPEETLPV